MGGDATNVWSYVTAWSVFLFEWNGACWFVVGILLPVLDAEVVEQDFEVVLGGQTGVKEVALDAGPFLQTTIIEQLQVVGDDEWDDIGGKTLFKHNQASHSAISVLERMDGFEPLMKVDDVFKGMLLGHIVFFKQVFHLAVNVGRGCRLHASHFIRQSLVISHSEPVFSGVGCAGLEHEVQLLDECLGQPGGGLLDNTVYTAEVVSRLDDVIHLDGLIGNTDGVGFKDVARLVMGQSASLNVVGVVSEVDLDAVIDATWHPAGLLFLEC